MPRDRRNPRASESHLPTGTLVLVSLPPADLPAISVLLPVYNAERFLPECLDSLEAQTLKDFEVIALDDGSTDGSWKLLEDRAQQDRRFRPVSRPHRGLVTTLNDGLDLCRGPLLARMDADDRCEPHRLEAQAAAFAARPAPDVVSCLVEHFPTDAVGDGFRIYEAWLNGLRTHDEICRERFVESPIPHPTAIIRSSALRATGGYREAGFPEDYDLWLRLMARGARFCKVPEVLYHWRHHDERLTRKDPVYSVERFLACKAHHLAKGPLAGCEKTIVWGAGQTGRRLSKHLLREGVALETFVDIDPKKIGRTLRSRPVIAPEELPALLHGHGRAVVLAAVSSRGARALIRARLSRLDLIEGEGFWCVA